MIVGKKIGITCCVMACIGVVFMIGYFTRVWEDSMVVEVAIPEPVVVAVSRLAGEVVDIDIRYRFQEVMVVIENGAFRTYTDIKFDEVDGLAERAEELRQFCMDALKVKGGGND